MVAVGWTWQEQGDNQVVVHVTGYPTAFPGSCPTKFEGVTGNKVSLFLPSYWSFFLGNLNFLCTPPDFLLGDFLDFSTLLSTIWSRESSAEWKGWEGSGDLRDYQ